MTHILNITLIGLITGVLGTCLGGMLTFFLARSSKQVLGFLLDFSAGLMLSVVCFELLPEAFKTGGVSIACIGVVLGTIAIIILDDFIRRLNILKKSIENKSMFRTGVLMAIGVSLHNFPEGIAVGAGFEISIKLGLSIAIIIAIHDIPEGMVVALPLRISGMSKAKTLGLTFLSGLPTVFGAFFGALLGQISKNIITLCLGFAGGAMIYIVCNELMPEAKKLYRGRLSSIGNMVGILVGIFISLG